MTTKNRDVLKQLTTEEKAELCSGKDYWHTKKVGHAGVQSFTVSDGPHGLRKRDYDAYKGKKNINPTALKGIPSICYPTAATTACSWDSELLFRLGQALGEECLSEGISVLLGPGTNIKRSPLCGRNFEYFSEDPILAGKLASAFIKGVQSKGVGTSLKHYAINNQETRRMTIDAIVDERAMREIYLRPFEIAVKESKPWTIMCAYNRINGTYCSENTWLLTDVLRKEWGFDGIVVTDWGAENNRVSGLLAGQDLEMPYSGEKNDKRIVRAVSEGKIPKELLDETADRLISLHLKSSQQRKRAYYDYDVSTHRSLARDIAAQSIVLLKNDNHFLPLKKELKTLVVGEMATSPRYQGAGSSLINPIQLDSACSALDRRGYNYEFVMGYSSEKNKMQLNHEYKLEAVEKAKDADRVVIFAGLPNEYETEGLDRKNMAMPDYQNELIKAISDVNKNITVVLFGGSAMEVVWYDNVASIIMASLGGETVGEAVVDVLYGEVNPSGKLAETYPFEANDAPCAKYFPGGTKISEYRESVFVGYRYYDTVKKPVRFPFGFGMSYTTFKYSAIKLSSTSINDNDTLTVEFKIKNTGKVAGAEVAQIYVSDIKSTAFRPKKELKAFKKVFLEPGEEKVIQVELDRSAFAYYNTVINDWHVETGTFEILVGASVEDIKLKAKIKVANPKEAEILDCKKTAPCYYSGDVSNVSKEEFEVIYGREIPANIIETPLNITNTFEDAEHATVWGARFVGMLNKFLDKNTLVGATILQSPLKLFVCWSMGVFSEDMANAVLTILNEGRVLKGAGAFIRGLPKAIRKVPNLLRLM